MWAIDVAVAKGLLCCCMLGFFCSFFALFASQLYSCIPPPIVSVDRNNHIFMYYSTTVSHKPPQSTHSFACIRSITYNINQYYLM